MAYGLDQIHNAYENMKSRYQDRALPPGTFIQQSYRARNVLSPYRTSRINFRRASGLAVSRTHRVIPKSAAAVRDIEFRIGFSF